MIEIPLHIFSVQNVSTNWHAVARRRKVERETVGWAIRNGTPKPSLPVVVKLTRIAPRKLDGHDNLQAGFKAPVDAIAEWLGVTDKDPRVHWTYAQVKRKPHEYAVQIEFFGSEP